MRRDYEESWLADGSIFDAIAAMRARMESLVPRNPRFAECAVRQGPYVAHGVEGPWSVTIEYEADDPT